MAEVNAPPPRQVPTSRQPSITDRFLGIVGLRRTGSAPSKTVPPSSKTTTSGKPKAAGGKARMSGTATSPKPAETGQGPTPAIAATRSVRPNTSMTLSPTPPARTPATPAPVPSTPQRTPESRATPEEIARIKAFRGVVLTAQDADDRIKVDDAERRLCAVLEDGTFLKEQEAPFAQAIMAVHMKLKRAHIPIAREILVEASLIRQVYEEYARRAPRTNKGPITTERDGIVTEISAQQMLFLDIVKHASSIMATDIRILIKQKEAEVWLRVGGAYQKYREYQADQMSLAFSAIFNLLSDVKNTYDRKLITQAVLTRERVGEALPERVQGLRMQFLPSGRDGSFLAARMITEDRGTSIDIDALGWSKTHLMQFKTIRRMPWGVIYVTGPTGSGKSTTLKVSLEAVALETGGEASILTAEDPSEYTLDHGIIQFSMTGTDNQQQRIESYTKMIMSLLRSDPDVVAIGEVREEQSSSLALRSAETGHPTWTTLHANNTISIFSRLRGMKMSENDVFNPQLVVAGVAQRLVRQVCPHCAMNWSEAKSRIGRGLSDRIANLHADRPDLIEGRRFRNENGCSVEAQKRHGRPCKRGYSGRTLVAEVLITDETLMHLAKENRTTEAVRHWKDKLNGVSMAEHGWYKVVKGICDPGDVEAAIGDLDVGVEPARFDQIVRLSDDNGISLNDLIAEIGSRHQQTDSPAEA